MMTEKELMMYRAQDRKVRVKCVDGTIVEGIGDFFTQPLDNEPEIAEITIRKGESALIGITEPEIDTIEYLE